MVAWPSLPAPLINTFNETFADNIIRTDMDRGVAKVRRRSTANSRPLSFTMLLTEAQLDTLRTFYNTTTLSGSIEFDYTHPIAAVTEQARFTQPPALVDVNGLAYRVNVSLELMP
jgi:hypothetical protein